MKKFKSTLLISCIIFSLFACSDDDDSTTAPGGSNPSSSNATELIGKWSAFEFKGDDGVIYGVNQFVPYYDSNAVSGCVIRDYEEKIIERSYTFSSDSILDFNWETIDKSRSWTVNNATTCDFTYGTWMESPFNFSGEFIYRKLGNNQLVAWERATPNDKDTVSYTLLNGILSFDDDPDVKYRK